MAPVVTAITTLHGNLPPTLSTTQVNSVRKKLKTELINLIKHPPAYEFIDTLTPILLDLGMYYCLRSTYSLLNEKCSLLLQVFYSI